MSEQEALAYMKQTYLIVLCVANDVVFTTNVPEHHKRIKKLLMRQLRSFPGGEEEIDVAISLYNIVDFGFHVRLVSENPSDEWFLHFTEDLWTVLCKLHPSFIQLRLLYT